VSCPPANTPLKRAAAGFNFAVITGLIGLISGCVTYVPPERLELAFDAREWTLANHQARPGHTLTEYLLAGESRSSWSESLGATFSEASTGDTVDSQIARLKSQIESLCGRIAWQTLSRSPSELRYHWSISNCPGQQDQHELGIFFITAAGVHRAAYVRKTTVLADSEADYWFRVLSRARVVSVAQQ